MNEQTSNLPPPLPQFDEQAPIATSSAEWLYVANGERRGPISATAIQQLLNRKEITADTPVWRKGMLEWKPLRETSLAELVASEPPPISSSHIGNGYVWVLALMPLAVGLIEGMLAANNYPRGLPLQVPALFNALLGWIDYRLLEKAGYKSTGLRVAAILLTPVYLFMRARRLNQRPVYAMTWLASFAVGLLIYGAAAAD
ncbi:DUF4339 domain-containing protein [Bradyrhizobium sp. CCGUVB14]|uniref:DUF4339 domain-containing protein n=1 Tax=Bradyrhizobium sp. CCGUVB14 TaxID=2949628 RepID=UPI0020B3C19F|nr:DUF4339 domain-containing protein [Bradyrhizobium sp. CCGUVB14]MCP3446198.1 DUF4339 domain-containing protein [Bradyrhizobium sp. CCGUVB14]